MGSIRHLPTAHRLGTHRATSAGAKPALVLPRKLEQTLVGKHAAAAGSLSLPAAPAGCCSDPKRDGRRTRLFSTAFPTLAHLIGRAVLRGGSATSFALRAVGRSFRLRLRGSTKRSTALLTGVAMYGAGTERTLCDLLARGVSLRPESFAFSGGHLTAGIPTSTSVPRLLRTPSRSS